jgi:hypothetical protein
MPTRRTIRQPVFDDHTHSQRDDFVGVIGSRSGDVRRIDLKILVAFATIMNGVTQSDIDRTARTGIAEMMQFPFPDVVPCGRTLTVGTTAFLGHSGTLLNFRLWQIGRVNDPLRRIRQVLTRSRHGKILRE